MTGKQRFIQLIYPFFEGIGKVFGLNRKIVSSDKKAVVSFYDLTTKANNGATYNFEQLRNKKVLIVNTASDCGYTPQYDDLQKLYKLKKDTLEIIAFPANDFGEQEKGNDKAIESFCKVNFGVSFPLMQKAAVLKNEQQSNIYNWLTDSAKNGWNTKAPSWNFCKYLIDENGNLTHFFEASVSPMGKEILNNL